MRYWVCKGRPDNDWDNMLVPQRIGTWWTRWVPKTLTKQDRLFFWESSPALRLVGFGDIVNPRADKDAEGRSLFKVRYLTRRLAYCPTITELRKVRLLNNAPFLKAGPATVLSSLSFQQAQALFAVGRQGNRGLHLEKLWPDLVRRAEPASLPDLGKPW